MFGRRQINTRRELVRAELEESLDLFHQAAVHAAGGVGATVGPSYGTARGRINSARGFVGPATQRFTNAASTSLDSTIAALGPIAEAARQGAAKAQKLEAKNAKKRSAEAAREASDRGMSGKIAIMLASGVAIGAAGALVMRRRNRAKWAEYEPSGLTADATFPEGAQQPVSSSTFGGSQSRTTAKVTSWAKDQSKTAYDSMRHKIHHVTADPTEKAKNVGSEMAEDAKSGMTKVDQTNEGASHLAGKSEARSNDPSTRTADTTRREGDSVDDLQRSAKNGRM